MIFGYMRISTQKASQTTDRQKDTLEKYAKDNSFEFDEMVEERISGTIKDFKFSIILNDHKVCMSS